MSQYCVFCGGKPENKNKEHIIPKWLINKTGNPNRVINLGIDFKTKDKDKIIRNYAFNQLTLPACEKCNTEFGILENKVKPIIENIVDSNYVNYSDISVLLDWFDKVRVGLWHYYYIMNQNLMRIRPHLYIKNRTRKFDRVLFIYRAINDDHGINFVGTDTFLFQLMPSVFMLRINNYYFVNISTSFLLSKRFGLPYGSSKGFESDNSDKTLYDIMRGSGRMQYPLLKCNHFIGGTKIYQPILCDYFPPAVFRDLYDSEYVRNLCIDMEERLVKPQVFQGNKHLKDLDGRQIHFEAMNEKSKSLYNKLICDTYEYQCELQEAQNWSIEGEKVDMTDITNAIAYNKLMVRKLIDEMSKSKKTGYSKKQL